MLTVLDLPSYLLEHGNIEKRVYVACTFDKQVDMPEHLAKYGIGENMYAVSINVVGVAFGSEDFDKCTKYIVRGKALAILGPKAFEPTSYGQRIFCLYADAVLREPDTNYVEFITLYNNKLYNTSTKSRSIVEMRQSYPEFADIFDELGRNNFDLDRFFSNYPFSFGYRTCSSGKDFVEISDNDKFVYKSDAEYWKEQKKDEQKIVSDLSGNVENSVKLTQTYTSVPKVEQYVTKSYEPETVESDKLVSRRDIRNRTDRYCMFRNKVYECKKKIDAQIEKLVENNKYTNIDETIERLKANLTINWRRSPDGTASTGRMIFKSVIEHIYPDLKTRYEDNAPFIDHAIDSNNLLNIWYTGVIPEELADNTFYIMIANDRESVYIGFVDYLLGLKRHLVNAYNYAKELEVDLLSLLEKNPYYLSLVDNRLSVEDLDKIAMLYGVNITDKDVLKIRNAAYIHNIMMDSSNDGVKDSTLVQSSYLYDNVFMGYVLSAKSYANLTTYDMIISDKIFSNLKTYIKEDITEKDFSLPKSGWKKKNQRTIKYILPFESGRTDEKVVSDYMELGLGIELYFDKTFYMIDYNYALKELYIIDRLYDLQLNGDKLEINENTLNRCIRAFENLKAIEWDIPNFKLEEKQIEAIKSLYNPVMCLTGPAGSGKTTTGEAILYALQALFQIDEGSIMFCAPTGKAANRLREIVKKPTRTINSLFGIGNESYTLMNEKNVKKKSDIKVLIVDESSMINIDLMYNMIRKISDKTRIIFMGDREQLPPIGAGKPFANLLSFLPCTVLEVTKRASENSGITQNAERVIYKSDVAFVEELRQYDDFRILETSMNDIVRLLTGIVIYHLGGAGDKRAPNTSAGQRVLQSLGVDLNPDDIQVITPVNKYVWGTRNLNVVLQNVFNPVRDKKTRRIRYANIKDASDDTNAPEFSEYRIGDRVIHTENIITMPRFLHVGKHKYQKITSTGIMNGDVGKIVDFVLGDEIKFVDKNGALDEAVQKEFSNDSDVLYVAVQYQDVDEKQMPLDYIVLYKTDIIGGIENMMAVNNEGVYTINSYSLSKIDLAYALTVHKIQGSQAKLIIYVIYPVGYSDFISRNMLYTGMTRAVQGIYLVGDVSKYNNIVRRARLIEQNKQRVTICDKIF